MNICKEVESRIRFFESKYNCLIILYEENGSWCMSTIAKDLSKATPSVEICGVDSNKYQLISAIRNQILEEYAE